MKLRNLSAIITLTLASPVIATAADVDIGQLYTGANRVQQYQVDESSTEVLSRDEIRLAGMRMFTNPFTKDQGFGDGINPFPSQSAGNHEGERGTLQGNGTFQIINGLDAQSCLECHSIVSRRKVPTVFGIGGVGGMNNTVLGAGGSTFVDLQLLGESNGDQKGNINGRIINPPFIFGAGGVELLAKEMTKELQVLRAQADANPGAAVALATKGVSFGSLTANGDGTYDTSSIEGLFDTDATSTDFLVVAPFGRKGDAKSTRTFDEGATSFHFGMAVDEGADHDNDGVTDEILEGEGSALSIFVATAQTPFQTKPSKQARRGRTVMRETGCTGCHVPTMQTDSKILGFSSPEIGNDPDRFNYYNVDLTESPMNFKRNKDGGVNVQLFADLKRHFMGPSLAEFNGDAMFTTMRLWGVADTAPYLHDGRALTIRDAIVLHGADAESDANDAVTQFLGRSASDQEAVLAFLDTLRSPRGTFDNLLELAHSVAVQQGL